MKLLATATLLALLGSAGIQAEEADPIVVTGNRTAEKERVRELSRTITPIVARDDAMPRFSDPICFIAAGLAREHLLELSNRLAIDTNEAGIQLAGDGCHPNVAILFVDDGAEQIAEFRKSFPRLFGDLTPADIRKVIAQPGPVHAWWVAQTVNSEGLRANAIGATGGAANAPTLRVSTSSILVLPSRRDVRFAVIIIERKALVGLSLVQIADYVAMRTLAGARPADGETILSLFKPGATPPAQMSGFDRSYLKSVYEGQGNQRAGTKLDQIARSISRRDRDENTDP